MSYNTDIQYGDQQKTDSESDSSGDDVEEIIEITKSSSEQDNTFVLDKSNGVSAVSVESLRRELASEIDSIQKKVRKSLETKEQEIENLLSNNNNLEKSMEKEKREEMENMEDEKKALVATISTLKGQMQELVVQHSLLGDKFNVMKDGLESKIEELEGTNMELNSANKVLSNDLKCKDVSLALSQENIVYSRQNTEAANKIIEVKTREIEKLRKQLEKLQSDNEVQGLQIKSLTKQLEIDKLTKEIGQLSYQIKRKQVEEEQEVCKKLKSSRGSAEKLTIVAASKRNNTFPSDEELNHSSDVASNYDPEEEVEEELAILESMKGEVERIFSHRSTNNNGNEYYVKWKNMSYAEATWEEESFIKTQHKEELYKYNARKKSKSNPLRYSDAIKHCKRTFKPMKDQPDYIGNEILRLRNFQLDGVNFLLKAWHNGNSVILADEKGLGKTIQTIAFLKYLFHNYTFKGPMLVCVPISALAAWQMEFLTWAPDITMVCYAGDYKSRKIIRNYVCENALGELTFNVLLTSYELVCKDKTFFQDIVWSNIVLDEAHRLKNKDSLLYKVLMGMESHHRLLLTGSPPLSSLEELWCFLNFLKLQDIDVDSWEEFEATYGSQTRTRYSGHVKLHTLLKPYIIRRMKKCVGESLPWFKVQQ